MNQSISRLRRGFAALLAALACCAAPAIRADNIEERSELKVQPAPKMASLLFVGTSGANPNRDLGNKQALVAAEMRKLLKARGMEVYTMGLRPDDPDPRATVAQAVRKSAPSHLIHLTVPQGTVSVNARTREQIAAVAYTIHVEATDAATNALVWEYAAEVKAGAFLGASNAQAAEAIVKRMQQDCLVP
jgi:hypothetical protein